MNSSNLNNRQTSASLTDKDYNFLCKFVYDSTGIVLNENKREMLYRRLTRIIRDKKLDTFGEYCRLLKDNTAQEKDYFINAITTNLTSFFRENHHFDYLINKELPNLSRSKKVGSNGKKRLRIWSSASSTGEEPYSIAISVVEGLKADLKNWDAKILATDIDSNVLAHGKSGVYELKRIEDINESYKKKYFNLSGQEVHTDQRLKDLITFKQLNLLENWPMKGPFDIIFCRNVIIYFDKKTQQALFEKYYEMLVPGGLFLLGHSENLGDFAKYFENVGRTIFRKPL